MKERILRLKIAFKAMMLVIMLVVIGINRSIAERVTPEVARNVAATFFNNNGVKSSTVTDISKAAGFSNLYIFNADNGFVILSADDRVKPILGYSLTGKFVTANMPENLRGWLQGYDDEIQYAVDNNLRSSTDIMQEWNDLKNGKSGVAKFTVVVEQLIQTRWNQLPGYNDLCPYDEEAGEHTPTGCVATAMAQIMKYYEKPTHGYGSHSYTPDSHPEYGSQSVNFGNSTYNWNAMPLNNSSSEIAKLMYHCGVSVNMDYDPEVSLANGLIVINAMNEYFDYTLGNNRFKEDHEATWINDIKDELQDNRPLFYWGSSSNGGHAFICDGYDDGDNFHFNWGWGGLCNDAYYSLDALLPQDIIIYGNYTDNQGAIFGLQPIVYSCEAPTNLSAIVNNNNVTLTWTAAEDVESYRIYRDDVMIESSVTGTSYIDSELALGDYTYYLRSNCSDESTSAASNTVIAEVDFPGNVTATIGNLRYSLNTQKHVAQVIGRSSGYNSGNLVIPSSVTYNKVDYNVTSIGYHAFYLCDGFTGSLTIPNSVTSIENGAFCWCSALTSLTIPNSVISIGNSAFRGCSGLTGSLTIPNSVTSIGNNAFRECSGLTGSLTIPNSVTSIGNYAFHNCSFNGLFIDMMDIPDNFNSICDCTFSGSLTIGNSVTSIGGGAFSGCTFSGSLTIGNSVTSFGRDAFSGCSFDGLVINLTEIPGNFKSLIDCTFMGSLTLGNSVTSIEEGAFSGCTFSGSLTIGNSVTSIGNSAFAGCSGFTGSLIIPNSVTSIGNGTFSGCSGFTGLLTIPSSVTSIGYHAFSGCSGFTGSLTIPNSVTSIDVKAFSGCSFDGLVINLTEIPGDFKILVDCTFSGSLTIGNSVTSIGEGAFSGCSGFTGSLTIGNSVTSIGGGAFRGCSGFTGSLTIPNSVTSIGVGAFSGCSGFTGSLTIPNSVTSIGGGAFSGCSGFTGSLTIPNSVTSIGVGAFSGCSGFTGSLTIPNSITSIAYMAFDDCSGFTGSLTIGNSVTSIGGYAFNGCSGFTGSLTIPNSVTSIEVMAFSGCSGFTGSLTIPNSVTSIGNSAFSGCSGFTGSLTIGNSVTSIGGGAFRGCSGFTGSLTIPNSITIIEAYAFTGIEGIASVIVPNSVVSIKVGAFEDCSSLSSIIFPNSVTTIQSSILEGCNNLTYIEIECLTPPTVDQYTFYGVDKFVSVKVPCGTQDEYKSAQYWSEFENIHETEYGLVVTRNDGYGGKVSILDMADCEDNHCVILAEPSVGYTFNGWYVDDEFAAGSELYNFSLTEDVAYEARFSRNENHYIANGTSNTWSNPDTWDTGEVPTETSTVAIYKSIVVDVDANVSAMGVYDDNTITINSDVVLTVDDELVSGNSSSIVVEDGGQIIHSNEDVMATVEKTIEPFSSDDDGWNLVSFPLVGNGSVASVTNMLSSEYDLFAYDEPSYTWINQKDENNCFTELDAGKGYLYANIGKGVGAAIGTKIGDGTSTTCYTPFYTVYNYSISEDLYLASELESAGLSTSALGALCLYATNQTGYQQNNINIWMANVSDTELTETSHNVSDMTLVYTGDMTPEIGWNEFIFNENTFTWDGTSNILVCVQRNNGVYNGTIYWQAHNPGFAALSYKYTDNSAYDMTTETYSMTVDYSRPNTIFQTVDQIGEFESYEPITMSFAGEIENGTAEVTVPLSYTSGNKLSGFNLVGNPFVHNVTSYEGYNVADGCYRINDAKTNLIVSNISNENPLKVGEGFFVKATGENAYITFNSQTRKSPDERGFVQLELVENDKIIDRLIVKKDGVPLKKMSLRGNHTELFVRYDSERVSIVPIQGPAQHVCFKATKMGNYTISINIENLDIDYLHLIDNFTGKDIDLLIEPQYTFVGASDDSENRFRLVFDKSANVNNSEIFAYQNGNEIIVSGNGTLQISDVMGRMVATQPINGVVTMYTSSLQTGVYIFRLLGESPRTQKIVVR
ncbi:MAG: leucine-rich repeat protein [Bacteroidales bacterium]|nr:leucine-rich repeat protein [Bacteroidales bacterium]